MKNELRRIGAVALLAACAGAQVHAHAQAVQGWVTTGDRGKLLARAPDAAFAKDAPATTVIDVDPDKRYQEIAGFGAAITDASGWLIQQRLRPAQRDALLRELFGRASPGHEAHEHETPGIGLSFTRLTIGASDFSRSHYSFDDMPPGQQDPKLERFSLAPQRDSVLPTVKAALAINPQLKVMASPWSAPGWMKSTDSLVKGSLKPQAYDAFARYLSRYVAEMKKEGVPVSALTLQNEPHFEPDDYPGMRVEPAQRAALIRDFLGPRLAAEQPGVQLFDWDHNWDEPESPAIVLSDPKAAKYVSGIAWHCYGGDVRAMGRLHDRFPDKDTWFTECSGGKWAPDWGKNLMYFTRTLVIDTTRGWARGVLLWNLALDENDGPFLGGCKNCRGVVTIDSRTGEVTRNVEYYALAHASRFVLPGARRIASDTKDKDLANVAFRNPDGTLVLLVANGAAQERAFSVRVQGRSFRWQLPAGSVATLAWRGDGS
ncbi:glycoside hydrolase family 30 beta sandwich domain-containing protein [Massilia sp. YIM B02763]|uniref:glycoside hydrolase family 30 protein n=1 Tax=Massilia sp. YIM B02763 TaxID=3050130 RepID=UPI0025B6756C|nr:glycoside hydrolase family 30 beta sandwich domain-containing protein [Massilia sp. YIM B02763]MDN4056517.1 glycoside hydrolase family 30 beta sandwich domain-containing protein [Massilia sp. YIM B02763]